MIKKVLYDFGMGILSGLTVALIIRLIEIIISM